MNEINVGEFVRTNKGIISTVIGQDDDSNIMLENQTIITKIEARSIKRSPNLIDLIEVRRLCKWR